MSLEANASRSFPQVWPPHTKEIGMFVNTTDAAGFAELEESFGIPTLATRTMTEYFGPYHAKHSGGFWSYSHCSQTWERHEHIDLRMCDYPAWLDDSDRCRFADVAVWARAINPPATPQDASVCQRQEPFLYCGYIFQWLFIPELARWELLPVGKHDSGLI